MWQLWQSPSPKSMSDIQRLMQILWKNRTLEDFFPENAKEQTVRRKMVNNVGTPNRMANNIGMLAKAAVGETVDSMIWSQQPVTFQRKTPLSPMTAYAYPVYTTMFSQHWMLSALEKKGMRKIKLEVDTGAAGNTLPLRIYKQMYKTLPPKDILEPTRNIKPVAYNGQEIPCLGSINLQLRFGEKKSPKKNHEGQVLCR